MSMERFIELLQQLITMTDPKDEESVLNAKNILKNLFELAQRSSLAHGEVLRAMYTAYREFTAPLRRKADFAGTPGDVAGNHAKRNRLEMMVAPHC